MDDFWRKEAKLTADDAAAGDLFGHSVSISGDTIVIGSQYNDEAGVDAGAAYVFTRTGGVWSQQDKLVADDGASDDRFGISVSVSGDTVVAGSIWDTDNGNNSGSAYVFMRNGDTWSQQAKLTAPDGAAFDWFGGEVGVSGDALVVSSPHDDIVADDGQLLTDRRLRPRVRFRWERVGLASAPDC